MLTIKVPMGKLGKIYFTELIAKYLIVAPTAPPTATHKRLIKLF